MRPRLFLHIITLQLRRAMTYRGDFWITTVLSFFIQVLVLFYMWQSIYTDSGVTEIAGYTMPLLVCHYVFVFLFDRILRGQDVEGYLAVDIYEGALTKYLLYPCQYLPFKYANLLGTLIPSIFQLLFFGLLGPWWLGVSDQLVLTPATILMVAGCLWAGNLVHFLLMASVQSVAFWADQVWALSVMVRMMSNLLGGLMLPLAMFPDRMREILYYTPFPYFFDVPVRILFGRCDPLEFFQGMGIMAFWAVVIGGFTRFIWARGYREYSGVGI